MSIFFSKLSRTAIGKLVLIFVFIDNCLTTNDTDSPSKLSPCISPWVFEGKLHKSCIKTKDGRRTYWCPTELNLDGQFISGFSDWGYCDLRKCK